MADRLTRWGNAAARRVELTPRVVEVLKACDVVRFSRSSWLFARVRKQHDIRDLTNFLKLLQKMRARGLIAKVDTRNHLPNAAYQPDVYFLTPLGEQTLTDLGHKPSTAVFGCNIPAPKNFQHILMVCDIIHSVNLGAELITQDQILAKAPVKELRIKLDIGTLTPDAVFGIRHSDGAYSFFALEADRGTESHRIIKTKMQKYLQMLTRRLYKSHWALPNCWPLFVTTTAPRVENMKQTLVGITGRGHASVLFKARKGSFAQAPTADAHILTEPCSRAGYPAFEILK